jgi:malate dehydrogenase (oxaloacetate-decarboxylating)
MVDSHGLVSKARSQLEDFKRAYARELEEVEAYNCANRSRISLVEAIANARPTILNGTSATPGLFTREVVESMSTFNERPTVFPISNPTSEAECTPEDAIQWSGGSATVATGSPFAPVEYMGVRYRTGQANDALLFPGVGLGEVVARATRVTDGMLLDAAKTLADMTTAADLEDGAVCPELRRIRECSHAVACATIRRAVEEGYADEEILVNLEETVQRAMWFPEYLPMRFEA